MGRRQFRETTDYGDDPHALLSKAIRSMQEDEADGLTPYDVTLHLRLSAGKTMWQMVVRSMSEEVQE